MCRAAEDGLNRQPCDVNISKNDGQSDEAWDNVAGDDGDDGGDDINGIRCDGEVADGSFFLTSLAAEVVNFCWGLSVHVHIVEQ